MASQRSASRSASRVVVRLVVEQCRVELRVGQCGHGRLDLVQVHLVHLQHEEHARRLGLFQRRRNRTCSGVILVAAVRSVRHQTL